MIDLFGWFGQLIGRESKARERAAVKAVYEKLRVASEPDTRSRLAAEIASRDFGLLHLAMKMPYAIELAVVGARSQLDGPDLNHLCGIIALTQDDPPGAQRFLEEAIAVAPEDERIRNSLAIAHLARGNTAGALVALSEALALSPNFVIAQANLDAARGGFHRVVLRSE
jgi:hypothetical protein